MFIRLRRESFQARGFFFVGISRKAPVISQRATSASAQRHHGAESLPRSIPRSQPASAAFTAVQSRQALGKAAPCIHPWCSTRGELQPWLSQPGCSFVFLGPLSPLQASRVPLLPSLVAPGSECSLSEAPCWQALHAAPGPGGCASFTVAKYHFSSNSLFLDLINPGLSTLHLSQNPPTIKHTPFCAFSI